MREQDNNLRALHQLAEELIADAEYDDAVAEKILDQLHDFDDCWNVTAERISNRKDQVNEALVSEAVTITCSHSPYMPRVLT